MIRSLKNSLRRRLALELFAANRVMSTITDYSSVNGYAWLQLEDETRLNCGELDSSFSNPEAIPDGFLRPVSNYLLRYLFPHFDPTRTPQVRGLPRKFYPLLHPQHRNAFKDLRIPPREKERLMDVFALSPGDHVLEAGAYFGLGTIQMSRRVGDTGRIVSLEALPSAQRILACNINEAMLRNVTVINGALGGVSGEVDLHIGGRQANSLVQGIVEGNRSVKVESLTLDGVLQLTELQPSLIVLTINGAELDALAADPGVLTRMERCRIITPGWYSDRQGLVGPRILPLLKASGFKVYATEGWHIFAFKGY